MEFQEGYADGLTGAGMQDRDDAITLVTDPDNPSLLDYERGFILGSLDRKDMLVNNS